jgi:hypothetical protein
MNDRAGRVAALVLTAVALATLAAGDAASQSPPSFEAFSADVTRLAEVYDLFTPWPAEEGTVSFVWVDVRRVLHRSVYDGENLRDVWKSFPLSDDPRELFVRDLDRDGVLELITYTGERIYVWRNAELVLAWESVNERFETVTALAIADVDDDDALELILCADGRAVQFDGSSFLREQTGGDEIASTQMVVGDVDGDGDLEVVTDDGFVLHAPTLTIEWTNEDFGRRLRLMDVNADGVPDLVGERAGGLQVWNLRDRVEIW